MTKNISGTQVSALLGPVRPDLIRSETLADIFRETAERLPEKTALTLIGQESSLTYAEFDRRSTRVAAALAARGVKRGDFVGLWFKRSIDLHVAMVGIVKSGAAFIPFDADAPAERVAVSLEDCGAKLLVSHEALARETAKLGCDVADLETLLAVPANGVIPEGPRPDSPAYAIYTSGSTGKPKGIVVTHRNISHYLRAGNEALGFVESDIVLQQASVAFDLSMEEIWVPYLVGATLKVATADTVKQTDRLPEILDAEGITVIDTVPTLLSMFDRDVASLRVIVLGGEACPPSIVARFARDGRRLLNTYGPTETTVVATWAELRAGDPVTIGAPLPNYTAYVVGEDLKPVAAGEQGELLVGGPGVAQGYINLPAMTAAKFIVNPFAGADAVDPVLYRTGDAVSLDAEGRIVFHGRIDDQVKIRGYRIELGEIEALIADGAGVKTAAVAVHHDAAGGDMLVAHVVAGAGFDIAAARKALATKVPPYMVPPVWRAHDELPRLPSGKVNRKALVAMPIEDDGPKGEQEAPRSTTEAHLLAAAKKVFGGQPIGFDADFFTDLGGHSLLAARFISEVRHVPALAGITLQDVYAERSLRKIAASLDRRVGTVPITAQDLSFEPPPFRRRFLCMLAQLAAMPVILTITTAQWLGVFFTFLALADTGRSGLQIAGIVCAVYAGINVVSFFLAIVLKWVILGRTKPGRYPLWGTYFFRWWLAQRVAALVHPNWFANSPIMRLYLRALGAKVGSDAMISVSEFGAPDLVEIGEGVSIGHKCELINAEIIGNELVIGRIRIGKDAVLGNQCVVPHDCVIGENARLEDLTALQPGQQVAAYEVWDGSPAKKIADIAPESLPAHAVCNPVWRATRTPVYLTLLLFLPLLGLVPIFPAFFVFDVVETYAVENTWMEWYHILPFAAWLMGAALVVFTLMLSVAIRWTILPFRVKEGVYSVHSPFYFRTWTLNLLSEVCLDTLSSLYATIYMRAWYRMMGAKIGRGAEVSTGLGARYDLVEIGGQGFMADECSLGDEDIQRGWMTLRRTVIEDRVFVGNNAVVPYGAHLAEGTLIGVKSKTPDGGVTQKNETWFGSPAIKFPVRQSSGNLAANWTFEPPLRMKIWRGVFEALHTTFPTMLFLTLGSIALEYIYPLFAKGLYLDAFLGFVMASCIMPVLMTLFVIAIKWLMMGVYKPVTKPMWSWWAMRTEAVAVLYWGLGGKVLLEHCVGTPFLPLALRMCGSKIGKGVYMGSTDITEFDCIKIGDFAVMNSLSCLQTHLYEDRVMKVGRVEIGKGVTIGSFATVLYDTKVGDWVQLGSLSLVMKGEELPANSSWAGAPAQPVAAHRHEQVKPVEQAAAAA